MVQIPSFSDNVLPGFLWGNSALIFQLKAFPVAFSSGKLFFLHKHCLINELVKCVPRTV